MTTPPTRPSTPQRRSSAESGRRRAWSDHDVEQVIGRLLQAGVVIASIVVIIGGAMVLVRHGAERPTFSVFRGESSHLRSIAATLSGVLAGDPRAIVQLGLVLLIATPVARVALTLAAFAAQRDRLYMAMTAVVLLLLLVGLLS
ncbi:MAG TPA: DUF1634 domain-containing protein [Gemmatimonadaceae bacterium]|nr:DUF1634 domain-containing protein [Gemmatimonadaceae bacterium]